MQKRDSGNGARLDYLRALLAARLSNHGCKQDDIAERLGISQAEVSRLLSKAEKAWNFYSPRPSFLRERVPEEDQAAAEQLLTNRSPHARVFRAWVPATVRCFAVQVLPSEEEPFFLFAADRVLQLLAHSSVVGVMWGSALWKLVNRIKTQVATSKPIKPWPLQCVPLAGDPVHVMHQGNQPCSASQLAAALEEALTGQRQEATPTLTGVHAYYPLRLRMTPEFRDHLAGIPGYRRIFGSGSTGPEPPLAERVDTFLTGVGVLPLEDSAAWPQAAVFLRQLIAQQESTAEELSRLAYGDFGGLLLAREGLGQRDAARVEALNQSWTGMQLPKLKQLAARAAANRAPGIVVVAAGAAKACMIREVMRRGLVNELIIDTALADALLALGAPTA